MSFWVKDEEENLKGSQKCEYACSLEYIELSFRKQDWNDIEKVTGNARYRTCQIVSSRL